MLTIVYFYDSLYGKSLDNSIFRLKGFPSLLIIFSKSTSVSFLGTSARQLVGSVLDYQMLGACLAAYLERGARDTKSDLCLLPSYKANVGARRCIGAM